MKILVIVVCAGEFFLYYQLMLNAVIDEKRQISIFRCSFNRPFFKDDTINYDCNNYSPFSLTWLMTNDFQVEFFSFNNQKQWKLSVCKKVINQARLDGL